MVIPIQGIPFWQDPAEVAKHIAELDTSNKMYSQLFSDTSRERLQTAAAKCPWKKPKWAKGEHSPIRVTFCRDISVYARLTTMEAHTKSSGQDVNVLANTLRSVLATSNPINGAEADDAPIQPKKITFSQEPTEI